jgi:hypothetical protein
MGIEIVENYEKPAKVNPYIADLKGVPVGTVFAVKAETRISENTGKVLGLTGAKGAVQEGARANGMTARVQEQTTVREAKAGEPGEVKFVFQLFPLQESGPRKKPETPAAK